LVTGLRLRQLVALVNSRIGGLVRSTRVRPKAMGRSSTPDLQDVDHDERPGSGFRLPANWWSLAVAATGLAAGVWVLILVAGDESIGGLTARSVLVVVVAWSFIASGLIAARRSSEARLGLTMALTGFAVLLGPLLQYAPWSLVFTLGVWVANAWLVLFVTFLVSFPHGRLRSRGAWLLLAPFVLALGPLMLLWFLFWDVQEAPGNAFLIWPDAGIADAVDWAQRIILAGGALVLTGVLARRWFLASASLRRSLTPILVGGAATVLASVTVILDAIRGRSTEALDYVLLVTLIAVPLAVLADMLRARLAQSAVGELVLELTGDPAPADLQDSLARALHDPTLKLAYWLPEFERYADRSGRPVEVRPEAGRTATIVRRGGKPVAALLHDASLQKEPALLDAVVAAAGIALENGRLESDLRARVEELRQSRSRIVEVAQTERRRLERDLHDGAQQRLVTLSLQLRALGLEVDAHPGARHLLEEARAELDESLRELRELARGIHPALLTERGLSVALESLVSRAPVPVELAIDLDARPPEAVELAAYYLVAESLTNVGKHAKASSARVAVAQEDGRLVVAVVDDGIGGASADGGSGLRGLADRVEALGGRLQVSSPQGDGTRLRAEIPYA
jgi:signal transduction histidine kinase